MQRKIQHGIDTQHKTEPTIKRVLITDALLPTSKYVTTAKAAEIAIAITENTKVPKKYSFLISSTFHSSNRLILLNSLIDAFFTDTFSLCFITLTL